MAFYRNGNYLKSSLNSVMKSLKFLKCALVFCVLFSCDKESKIEKEIEKIPVKITIERFDRLFADVNAGKFIRPEKRFPILIFSKVCR